MGLKETHKGLEIEFEDKGCDGVFARAPAWTHQYIGHGETKAEALRSAQAAIDNYYEEKQEDRPKNTVAACYKGCPGCLMTFSPDPAICPPVAFEGWTQEQIEEAREEH